MVTRASSRARIRSARAEPGRPSRRFAAARRTEGRGRRVPPPAVARRRAEPLDEQRDSRGAGRAPSGSHVSRPALGRRTGRIARLEAQDLGPGLDDGSRTGRRPPPPPPSGVAAASQAPRAPSTDQRLSGALAGLCPGRASPEAPGKYEPAAAAAARHQGRAAGRRAAAAAGGWVSRRSSSCTASAGAAGRAPSAGEGLGTRAVAAGRPARRTAPTRAAASSNAASGLAPGRGETPIAGSAGTGRRAVPTRAAASSPCHQVSSSLRVPVTGPPALRRQGRSAGGTGHPPALRTRRRRAAGDRQKQPPRRASAAGRAGRVASDHGRPRPSHDLVEHGRHPCKGSARGSAPRPGRAMVTARRHRPRGR